MKQAMVFAAGLGTRLRPLTDTMPKALIPVEGKSLLLHVIEKLKGAGYERIVVNVHHFADQIIEYLHKNNNFGLDIHISDEREALLDTGGGLKKAAHLFNPNQSILVHNVDILSNADLETFEKAFERSNFDAALMVSERTTKRYFVFDKECQDGFYPLKGWTNIETQETKPANLTHDALEASKMLAFSGIHLIHPRLLEAMKTWPEKFSITDFYINVCAHTRIGGFVQPNLKVTDVGKIETLNSFKQ